MHRKPWPVLRSLGAVTSAVFLVSCEANGSNESAFDYILHDGLTKADVAHLKFAMEDAYDATLSRLSLGSLPTITVQIWQEEENYQAEMEATLGARAPGSRGYITSDRELRLLRHTLVSAQQEAVHEFVHVASLSLNPDFGNNPRWLWEALALYYANEFVDPRTSNAFEDGNCPSLQQLNSPFDKGGAIYDSGFLLIEFIEAKWTPQSVLELVRTNGDLLETLNVTDFEFETAWCAFVMENYFSSVPE